MSQNKLKNMARTKTLKLGHFIVEFATPGIGHIMKAAGCEFALFDLEHSGFGFETVKSAIRYFDGDRPNRRAKRSMGRGRTVEPSSIRSPKAVSFDHLNRGFDAYRRRTAFG